MKCGKLHKTLTTLTFSILLSAFVGGCVVLPQKDLSETVECGLSSDRKVLRVVNLTDGDTSFYRWSDELVAFITIPASAIVSGTYVLVNNIYHTAEKTIKCGNTAAVSSTQTKPNVQNATEDNIEPNKP
ncbi:hypothetical protein [Aliiglaciecola litoralis]|uniref:Lipoprotein n=1 Tax=Aliiglaciecola litoralis TaxID=582857 RepID=A0ABP3WQM2_9ALTE